MTTKAQILRVIRENCCRCVVGDIKIIEDCGSEETCVLFPYRFGKDPNPAKAGKGPSRETTEKALAGAARAREKRKILNENKKVIGE
jgi:hypothetical protein